MKHGHIRPLVIGIFWRGDAILVARGKDTVKEHTYYRPLGGGIEFGEYGAQALAREMREELGAEICDVRYLGMLENLFTYLGNPGHEIVLVYEAKFVDSALYLQDTLRGVEDNGQRFTAEWRTLAECQALCLYPDGLAELLVRATELE